MGCSLARVADMSHLHIAQKKKYSSLKYEVMLGLDHSGCYQASIPPTAMTQPRPLLPLILRLLSLPLFNEGPEYHHGKILELVKMFELDNFDSLMCLFSLETKR